MMHSLKRAIIPLLCVTWLLSLPLQGQLAPLPTSATAAPNAQETIEEMKPELITHPGIVAWRDGKWLWSDHLFNLSRNIDVNVEYASTDNMKGMVDTAKIRDEVEEILRKVGITPYARPDPGKPNLPSLHLLILAHPIRDGYMFTLIVRLFEPVQLDRIKLDDRVTMQAITWERASIHVVQRADFDKEINSSVREIVEQFALRFEFFEKLR
ncbi:MAG: hypothetical protein AAGG81_03915, partial [Chlamydiota bacterium]